MNDFSWHLNGEVGEHLMLAEDGFATRRKMKLLRTFAEMFFGDSSVSTLDGYGGWLREKCSEPVFTKLEYLFGDRSYFKLACRACCLEILTEQRSKTGMVEATAEYSESVAHKYLVHTMTS